MKHYHSSIPKQPYPELFAELAAAIPLLPPNDKTFALSLHDGHVKYGGWSEKQAMWAKKMIEKTANTAFVSSANVTWPDSKLVGPLEMAADTADKIAAQLAASGTMLTKEQTQGFIDALKGQGPMSASVIEQVATDQQMVGILKVFVHAGQHLKAPSIKIKTALGKPIVIKPSKKYPGALVVVSDTGYPNKWYGNILPNGVFNPKMGYTPEFVADIKETLKAFADDPAGVAAKYGKMHGKCCFCSKGLTDEKSTSVGYGPICAQHYGLPWGEKSNGYSKAVLNSAIQAANAMKINAFKNPIFSGVDLATKPDSMSINLFTTPSGALHQELKAEAEAAKAPGEKFIPVLSPEEYEKMRQKVEILF